jgi:hypothetical protein
VWRPTGDAEKRTETGTAGVDTEEANRARDKIHWAKAVTEVEREIKWVRDEIERPGEVNRTKLQ